MEDLQRRREKLQAEIARLKRLRAVDGSRTWARLSPRACVAPGAAVVVVVASLAAGYATCAVIAALAAAGVMAVRSYRSCTDAWRRRQGTMPMLTNLEQDEHALQAELEGVNVAIRKLEGL